MGKMETPETIETTPIPKTHEDYLRQKINGWWEEKDRGEISDEELKQRVAEALITADSKARTDSLTRLPNEAGFKDDLALEFEKIKDGKISGGIMVYLDGDGIKKINDSKNHEAGDEAIVRVSKATLLGAGPSDLIARLHGDEFALWCPDASVAEVISRIMTIKEVVEQLCAEDFPELDFSSGIVPYHPGDTPERLIKEADNTMYDAKVAKRGSIAVFGIQESGKKSLQDILQSKSWNDVNIINTHIPRKSQTS